MILPIYTTLIMAGLLYPPARLTKVLILENYENLSDRKTLEMLCFNIKWKYTLDVPIDYEGFDRSLLVYFRARLLINHKEKMLFKKTLELAREMNLLKKERSRSSYRFYSDVRSCSSKGYL